MASHALDQRLFEQTANIIGEHDPATTSPTDGVQLINGWLKVIQGTGNTERIETKLKELSGQLQLAKPDPERIRELLMTLADHTSQLTQGGSIQQQTVNKLENVATSLRLFLSAMREANHWSATSSRVSGLRAPLPSFASRRAWSSAFAASALARKPVEPR